MYGTSSAALSLAGYFPQLLFRMSSVGASAVIGGIGLFGPVADVLTSRILGVTFIVGVFFLYSILELFSELSEERKEISVYWMPFFWVLVTC